MENSKVFKKVITNIFGYVILPALIQTISLIIASEIQCTYDNRLRDKKVKGFV